MPFALHPRLAAGTHLIGVVRDCHVLLKKNAAFPWLLIVPETDNDGIEDLHQLSPERYEEVTAVIRQISVFVSEHFQPEKLNVACIGNMVRQMHIHIVGRSPDDAAWPGTVWASDEKAEYSEEEIDGICEAARLALGLK